VILPRLAIGNSEASAGSGQRAYEDAAVRGRNSKVRVVQEVEDFRSN